MSIISLHFDCDCQVLYYIYIVVNVLCVMSEYKYYYCTISLQHHNEEPQDNNSIKENRHF